MHFPSRIAQQTIAFRGIATLSPAITRLILHLSVGWAKEQDLFNSVEYSNASVYRSKVIAKLHKDRMIEYDKTGKRARISPKGSGYVEKEIVAPRL